MTEINFEYAGQTFKAEVPEDFKNLPKETQQQRLYKALYSKHGRQDKPTKQQKNILDYLSFIERPAQALKVGLKETNIGGAIHQALGGVDLTPSEGLFTGMKRGWMGNDEIRTQDYLPDDMNPILKGVLGFAGDVATDPVTYFGPQAVMATGGVLKKGSDMAGISSVVGKGVDAAMSAKFGQQQVGLPDVLRGLNVATGAGKQVKGSAQQASKQIRELEEWVARDLVDLEAFFDTKSRTSDVSLDKMKEVFREAMERETTMGFKMRDTYDEAGKKILDKRGNPVKEKVPMMDDEGLPLTDDFGNQQYQKVKTGYVEFTDEQRKILGNEGTQLAETWNSRLDDIASMSNAFGQPIRMIQNKGYFPRVMTAQAADRVRKLKLEETDPEELLKPVFGANYRQAREEMGRGMGIDEASAQFADDLHARWVDSGAGSANPVDIPYFQLDPIVAIGTRLAQQQKALQKKWFLDEITDNGYGIGPQFQREDLTRLMKDFRDKQGGQIHQEDGNWTIEFLDFVKVESPHKQELNIGKWLKADTVDGKPAMMQRVLNPAWRGRLDRTNDQFLWEPASKADLNDYRVVDGIPEGWLDKSKADDIWDTAMVEEMSVANLDPRYMQAIHGIEGNKTPQIRKALQEAFPQTKFNSATLDRFEEAGKKADELVQQARDTKQAKFYAPKQIARQIEDTMDIMSAKKSDKEFLRWYDKVQNGWKAWTLGVRPAYHTRNAIGNMWNAYLATGLGENPVKAAKTYMSAAELQYYARFRGDPALRKQLIDNMKGLKSSIHQTRQIQSGKYDAPNFAGTGFTMRQLVEGASQRGVTAGHYTKDNIRDLQIMLEAQAGTGNRLERIIGPENPFVKGGFAVGGTIEGNARYGVFLHTLQKIKDNPGDFKWVAPDGEAYALNGKIPDKYWKTVTDKYPDRFVNNRVKMTYDDMVMDTAAREVQGALFDYADVSRFERNVLKRVMPFYTWSRKNIPVQLKHLVLNPQRAEKLVLAKQQFEHETGELDHTDYGKFWGERVPVFLGNEKDGVVQAFTLLNLMPMADIQRLLPGGPSALINDLTSPLIKQPFEQIANYDTFMKRQIKTLPDETQDFLGVSMSPRMHHLVKLLVPLTEINRVNPAGVFGERILDPVTGVPTKQTDAYLGLGAKRETYKDVQESARWLRFFSGVAKYDVNLNRDRYFMNKNLKKDLAELKGKLKWALRKGQNRKAQQLLDLIEAVDRGETTDPFERRS